MIETVNTRNLRLFSALLVMLQQHRSGVSWSHDLGAYVWNSNGRIVSDAKIQSQLDGIVEEFHKNVERLAERLDSGNLSIADWQERMRREILDIHRTQYIVGRGGVENMTPRDWGRLGSDLRWMHYDALDNFALEIAEGNLSPAQISARSKLYMNSSNKQYWRGKTEAKLAAGYTEMKRDLSPAEHCPDCVGYAAQGWVPIGGLPLPGEESQCRSNCRCTVRWRK